MTATHIRRARNSSDDCLNDIIELQLKKPKSWNWELSTSKSSPHIMLPTIKLYNSKGKLLVEARDNGTQRQSWHSSGIKPTTTTKINNLEFRDSIPRHLRKCRSEILEKRFSNDNNIPTNKNEYITDQKVNIDNTKCKQSKTTPGKTFVRLRKSRSTVLEGNKNENDLKPSSYRHQRTRSDDVYQRMMKYNEESLKRAIADGYRSFIKPLVSDSNEIISEDEQKCTQNQSETVLVNNNHRTMEVNHIIHKRYETRTCSAGTLIISGESFNESSRRHRCRNKMSDEASTNSTKKDTSAGFKKDNAVETLKNTLGKCTRKSFTTPTLVESVNKLFDGCERFVPSDSNNNCDYIVEEPVTPSSEVKEHPFIAHAEKLQHRKHKKRRKSHNVADSERSRNSTSLAEGKI